ncbi:MAG: SEL1-like repeat protein [Planctomycetes bacterium]|nr:SEL1-like repeat protein [Planctomycetota bacterium]
MLHSHVQIGIVLCALSFASVHADAQRSETLKLTSSHAAADDVFGWSVAVSGTTAVIGAKGDAAAAGFSLFQSGAAYVFDTTTGTQQLKLFASDAAGGDHLGWSVAISGNTAIVGAPDKSKAGGYRSGAAYVFDTTTGDQLLKLTASDAAMGDDFGWSVAITGNIAVVGDRTNTHVGIQSGAAYVFDTTTGKQLFKLAPSDGVKGDLFGCSVAISGNIAVVGASGNQYAKKSVASSRRRNRRGSRSRTNGRISPGSQGSSVAPNASASVSVAVNGSGAAYVFDLTTGKQQLKLAASDGAPSDRFGCSVAISGNIAVIGASGDDDAGDASGAAYVFDLTTGKQLFKLSASDAAMGDSFGRSVAISGNIIVVGAAFDDEGGRKNSGAVYVFKNVHESAAGAGPLRHRETKSVSTPLRAEEGSPTTEHMLTECDRLAASPFDPGRKANGVEFKDIDAAAAIEACRQAVRLNASPRLQYQYCRSLLKDEQHNEAVKWLHKAAEQGYAAAQNGLGVVYAMGTDKNYEVAMEWYRKAADQDLATAQISVGVMYANGQGVPKNNEEAVKWYRKAVVQDLPLAQFRLGLMYAKGWGVTKNAEEAVKWYLKAAKQGNGRAQTNLGVMYFKGEGVAKNDEEAAKWYRKAAEQGYARAQQKLGVMYFNGEGVPKNDAKAVQWYRKAAEQEYAEAQHKLGLMYHHGEGVPQDYQAGAQWIERAAVQGHADAQNDLGAFYQSGKGVPIDYQKAARFLDLASRQGNGWSQLNLGGLHYNGDGMPKDYEKAAYWFTKASRNPDRKVAREGRRWSAKLETLAKQQQEITRDDIIAGLIIAAVVLAASDGVGENSASNSSDEGSDAAFWDRARRQSERDRARYEKEFQDAWKWHPDYVPF